MLVAKVTEKMISFYEGSLHDISHFLKVYAYAQTIGRLEGLDEKTQLILELASVVHDIACPLCRQKYGNASGKHQEEESEALLIPFLEEFELEEDVLSRIVYLVSHHHTYSDIDGIDYKILLEADYLVNAEESSYSKDAIGAFVIDVFATPSGISFAKMMYGL